MKTEVAFVENGHLTYGATKQFSTFEVGGQLLGIGVLDVQDILNPMHITPIPLAGQDVAGLLNLRGRIVTAIDMRQKLGLDRFENRSSCMSIVVEKNDELYSLLVDKVRDVIDVPESSYESNPANLEEVWAGISNGVYRLDGEILVAIDVNRLLEYTK